MFWNDDDNADRIRVPDDIVDLLFGIDCKCIPVDHAYLLADALRQALPWIAEEPGVAVHSVHVAGSQNGWERPEHGPDSYLAVSRRTKLTLRVPRHRVAEVLRDLPGTRLHLGGEALVVRAGKTKPLSTETTLFSRYVALDLAEGADDDEGVFLETAARALAEIDVRVRKAVCGRTNRLATPEGPITTRSLMLAGLTPDESIRLQQRGIGRHPLLGCGIFIPHKGVDSVKPSQG
ncbi:type I-MYXAN CRISPR-associated protein Cas6/Cmx6 [Thiocapsa marina]|uniref:CRISPR-associated protein, Cas6-related protein n=1 Tax=Thiocapsa marina 5811 TaxID=768671 RepID=F9UDB6_9GAMM|nr:type I-MYXAN CRISPR-associated protein Cas6/Cmx6 [Thiocapsa marina]EGV17860.1 CRISPR-associated protein, Cas6-related protein [Thiocapsa marina 5811]